MGFIEELHWRGMIQDMTPGVAEQLRKELTVAYVGIDPTADSLHIGHLVSIMMLKHFQLCGHKPIALVGGATGMIGDPSGKSEERNLLDEETLRFNQKGIQQQLEKFLDFSDISNKAEIVNNYDWMKDFGFLGFLRDVGKHITINYMMTKDSVQKRMQAGSGISFTEFTYQLVQGYDFYWLNTNKNCRLQMGGADQWGNITTGTELIRRKGGTDAYAITCPLITKADGSKFGKTEAGNVWLDPQKTSPYKFYQFWLNCSDEDSEKYIKIFTLLSKEEVDGLIRQHRESPHLRLLQKSLAKDVTIRVHSEKDYLAAVEASEILFGKGTEDTLKSLDEETLLSVFEGVPQSFIPVDDIEKGVDICELLTIKTGILPSKSEARRSFKDGCIFINKKRIEEGKIIDRNYLLNDKYILVQKGKKCYYLIICR
ncbi:MAG TPA: tyrosine--tRNA ligase [Bacteroidales bacterium]|nr:tyrosine--tRNA ligase [Bacteroidales bacterium]